MFIGGQHFGGTWNAFTTCIYMYIYILVLLLVFLVLLLSSLLSLLLLFMIIIIIFLSFLLVCSNKMPPPDRPFGLWGRRMKKGCWFVCGQTKQILSWNLSKNWSDEPIICKERERYQADCQRECFTFVRWMWSATAQSCPCLLWLLCMFGRWCSAKLIHCSI